MLPMYWLLTLTFFLLSSLTALGQRTICDCCTYPSIWSQSEQENVFKPAIIRQNKIRELVVYTTSKQRKPAAKDAAFKVVNPEYREMQLKFNADGFIIASVMFNRLGQYHSIQELERGADNKIQSTARYYLDSLGQKLDVIDKRIYTYAGGRLQQIKKLGWKGAVEPDSKSEYTRYTYDFKGRIISEIRHDYIDDKNVFDDLTHTRYDEANNASTAITRTKTELFSTENVTYNARQQPVTERFYEGKDNKLLEDKKRTYNSSGQWIKLEVKNSGMLSECPDGGSYTDTLLYSATGLLSEISHQYKNTICAMRFEYR